MHSYKAHLFWTVFVTPWPMVGTHSPFLKLAPHSNIQFEISTWLRYKFLETFARSEKAHFCLKLSKNKTKPSKSNPVVEVRGCH